MRRPPASPTDDPGGPVACPVCGGTNTRLEQQAGSALCRTLYYCEDCREPFELFS